MNYPSHFYLNSGSGSSKYPLVAFDKALIEASISNYNLVKISSILPSGATQADIIDVKEGSPLLTAYARIDSNIPGTQIATAVGVAVPTDPESVGVIMEFSGYCSSSEASRTVREMCLEAMENHCITCKEVLITSIDAVISEQKEFTSLVSAVSIW